MKTKKIKTSAEKQKEREIKAFMKLYHTYYHNQKGDERLKLTPEQILWR